jgi:hypothetical protein
MQLETGERLCRVEETFERVVLGNIVEHPCAL